MATYEGHRSKILVRRFTYCCPPISQSYVASKNRDESRGGRAEKTILGSLRSTDISKCNKNSHRRALGANPQRDRWEFGGYHVTYLTATGNVEAELGTGCTLHKERTSPTPSPQRRPVLAALGERRKLDGSRYWKIYGKWGWSARNPTPIEPGQRMGCRGKHHITSQRPVHAAFSLPQYRYTRCPEGNRAAICSPSSEGQGRLFGEMILRRHY